MIGLTLTLAVALATLANASDDGKQYANDSLAVTETLTRFLFQCPCASTMSISYGTTLSSSSTTSTTSKVAFGGSTSTTGFVSYATTRATTFSSLESSTRTAHSSTTSPEYTTSSGTGIPTSQRSSSDHASSSAHTQTTSHASTSSRLISSSPTTTSGRFMSSSTMTISARPTTSSTTSHHESSTHTTSITRTQSTNSHSSTTSSAHGSIPTDNQPFSIEVETGNTLGKRSILSVGYVNGGLALVSSPIAVVPFVITPQGALAILGTELVVGYGNSVGTLALIVYPSIAYLPVPISWAFVGGILSLPGSGFCSSGASLSVNIGAATDASCLPVTPIPNTVPSSWNPAVVNQIIADTPSPSGSQQSSISPTSTSTLSRTGTPTTDSTSSLASSTSSASSLASVSMSSSTGSTTTSQLVSSPSTTSISSTRSSTSMISLTTTNTKTTTENLSDLLGIATTTISTSSRLSTTTSAGSSTSDRISTTVISSSSVTTGTTTPASSTTSRAIVSTTSTPSTAGTKTTTSALSITNSTSTRSSSTTTRAAVTLDPSCSVASLPTQTAPSGAQYTQFWAGCRAAIPTTLGTGYYEITPGTPNVDPTAFSKKCLAAAEQSGASIWTFYQHIGGAWGCGIWNNVAGDPGLLEPDSTVFTVYAFGLFGYSTDSTSSTYLRSSTRSTTSSLISSATTTTSATTSGTMTSTVTTSKSSSLSSTSTSTTTTTTISGANTTTSQSTVRTTAVTTTTTALSPGESTTSNCTGLCMTYPGITLNGNTFFRSRASCGDYNYDFDYQSFVNFPTSYTACAAIQACAAETLRLSRVAYRILFSKTQGNWVCSMAQARYTGNSWTTRSDIGDVYMYYLNTFPTNTTNSTTTPSSTTTTSKSLSSFSSTTSLITTSSITTSTSSKLVDKTTSSSLSTTSTPATTVFTISSSSSLVTTTSTRATPVAKPCVSPCASNSVINIGARTFNQVKSSCMESGSWRPAFGSYLSSNLSDCEAISACAQLATNSQATAFRLNWVLDGLYPNINVWNCGLNSVNDVDLNYSPNSAVGKIYMYNGNDPQSTTSPVGYATPTTSTSAPTSASSSLTTTSSPSTTLSTTSPSTTSTTSLRTTTTTTPVRTTTTSSLAVEASCAPTDPSFTKNILTTASNQWVNFFASGCGLSMDWVDIRTFPFNSLYVYPKNQWTYSIAIADCANVADSDGSPVFEFETDARNNRWTCLTWKYADNNPAQFQPYPGISDAYGYYLPSRLNGTRVAVG